MDIHIGIDVGGTFTDLALNIPGEDRQLLHKLPSTPDEPARAIIDGIAAILAEHGLDAGNVVRLSHGTTVGTNALIQRQTGRVAVVTTEGFRDLLEIGRQTRPKVYDIHMDNPAPLVPRELRLEVAERMRADGTVHVPLDEDEVARIGRQLAQEHVDCVVVGFLHAYAYPAHEARAVEILRSVLPDEVHIVASASVYPEFREYERFSTAVLNGALLTVMNAYLDSFTRETATLGVTAEPKVSLSAGGLMSIDTARRLPIRGSLSGPAARVLGGAARAAVAGFPDVVTLDVGGTSADVSLLAGGRPTEVPDRSLAGFPMRMPTLDVNSVGAGGGSIAWIDRDDLMKVGPQSAGAHPGPACYDLGGEAATVTDANVLLGRLNPAALLDGRMKISADLAQRAIGRLATAIDLDVTETALGIVRVACANIVKAIRTISVERGHDPSRFCLFAFGGAGPLHAADVARELGISTVVVPPSPGVLCAEGLLRSDLRADFIKTLLARLDEAAGRVLTPAREALAAQSADWFAAEALNEAQRQLTWRLDMRYYGQNYELAIPVTDRAFDAGACRALMAAFHRAHEQAYGFASEAEPIEIVSMKVKATGVLDRPSLPRLEAAAPGEPAGRRRTLFGTGDWHDTPVFRRDALAPEQRLAGPAIIEQLDTTVPLFPGDACRVDEWGNLVMTLG